MDEIRVAFQILIRDVMCDLRGLIPKKDHSKKEKIVMDASTMAKPRKIMPNCMIDCTCDSLRVIVGLKFSVAHSKRVLIKFP